ncbi:MAG: RICIN domain-containing protein [Acidobacteriota bacterium]
MKTTAKWSLALVLAVCAVPAAQAGDLPNGRYAITVVQNGKCVDVAWASTADGANIAQVTCSGNNAQQFDVTDVGGGWYQLINVNSGKAIDVASASIADGANVQQWTSNGSGAQRFAIRRVSGDEFTIVNQNSNKCVDVAGASNADGANIQQWTCYGGGNQRFKFNGKATGALSNGRYKLVSSNSGKCVDVTAASTADGANIQQYSCNGTNAQAFDVTSTGGGAYKLINVNSGKAVDVAGSATYDGANIQQWSDNGSNAQRFVLKQVAGDEYTVINQGSGKCMDVSGWATTDGANILQWSCHGGANQRYHLIAVSGGGSAGGGACSTNPVWSDEFNYSGLPDGNKWSFEVQRPGWVNHELQNYTGNRLENARVENGHLVIEARRDWYQGYEVSSARLKTAYKGDWLNGRIEVRAKLPPGRGTWPAIWLMPTDSAYGGWPNSGEIDIMENVGYDPSAIHGSIHTNARNFMLHNNFQATTWDASVESSYHTYAVDWNQDRIQFLKDGQVYGTFNNARQGWTTWPFDKRFYLILNLAIGGDWGGAQGVDMNILPARMEVDWVRVYPAGSCK